MQTVRRGRRRVDTPRSGEAPPHTIRCAGSVHGWATQWQPQPPADNVQLQPNWQVALFTPFSVHAILGQSRGHMVLQLVQSRKPPSSGGSAITFFEPKQKHTIISKIIAADRGIRQQSYERNHDIPPSDRSASMTSRNTAETLV